MRTDSSGRYACMYKRWHLIGLEVGISVASVGLRREPTGCPTGFRADVVATAKRDLKAGEILDGSKPAIESTAVCNATGLTPAPWGLKFPPASVDDIPNVMRPVSEGGHLHHKGQVEVISSLEADGRAIPYDIRFGVWVVFEGETEYIRNCFEEYNAHTDPSGATSRSTSWRAWRRSMVLSTPTSWTGRPSGPPRCARRFGTSFGARARRFLRRDSGWPAASPPSGSAWRRSPTRAR